MPGEVPSAHGKKCRFFISTTMDALPVDAVIEELLVGFNELNPMHVEELEEDPSPLEFMRSVARNTPFVIRRGASSWKAVRNWDAAYLKAALSGQSVKVAVTPTGYVTITGRRPLVLVSKLDLH